VCGALTNYWLNYHFTFHSNKSHLDAGPKFLAVAAIGFILNAVLMLLSRALFAGQHYLLRQACTTIIVLVWNFAGNRFWSFRERSNEIDR
jgi:putative flippase GtrA